MSYERLTEKTPDGYRADGLMAVERLGRLEDVIERLQQELARTQQALQRLQEQDKEHSATYRQLQNNQATLQELLLRLGC